MAIHVAACKAVSEIDQAGTAANCAGKPGSDKMTLRHLRILVPRRHKSEAAKLPERRKSHEWCKG